MPPFSVITKVYSVTDQQIPWKRKRCFWGVSERKSKK